MNIGEVSEKFNLSNDTLRYYEKIGLLGSIKKINGKRQYQDADIERINFVICMKKAGFTLDDIVKFISLYNSGDNTYDERIDMLYSQKKRLLEEIDEKKKTLDFLEYKIDFYNKKKKEKKTN